MSFARGVGGLLTTEVELVDLGTHGGRHLHGRVERRVFRLGLGGERATTVTLGRVRPVAVEVEDGGNRYDVAVPRVPDPWLQALRRGLALWAGSFTLTALVTRQRARQARRLDGGSR